MSLPRGIRNNNPLNIRRSKDKWKGMRAVQSDAQFVQFESLEWGWRAALALDSPRHRHGYSREWHRKLRLFRHAARVGALSSRRTIWKVVNLHQRRKPKKARMRHLF